MNNPTNNLKQSNEHTWLDRYERTFDNVLRVAWLVFIIKIVFWGY